MCLHCRWEKEFGCRKCRQVSRAVRRKQSSKSPECGCHGISKGLLDEIVFAYGTIFPQRIVDPPTCTCGQRGCPEDRDLLRMFQSEAAWNALQELAHGHRLGHYIVWSGCQCLQDFVPMMTFSELTDNRRQAHVFAPAIRKLSAIYILKLLSQWIAMYDDKVDKDDHE